jgi:hypothetical protein
MNLLKKNAKKLRKIHLFILVAKLDVDRALLRLISLPVRKSNEHAKPSRLGIFFSRHFDDLIFLLGFQVFISFDSPPLEAKREAAKRAARRFF